ncbi:MAG: hypothetical protein QF367_11345 [Acidimicrobiales bacterium]|nr:hypothetical protein [Acidimicrobiales bacterium]MEE1563768.1 hypothetical protein [Acidimicrobiales bacterium]
MRAPRAKSVVAALVIAPSMLVGALAWVAPVVAQVTTVETVPPEVDEEGQTAGDRVDQIVVTLRVIAGLMLGASGVYWWQTRPDRVVRAAIARGELERATARVEADAAAEADAVAASDAENVGHPELESGAEPDPDPEAPSGPAPGEAALSRARTSADVLAEVATATGNGRGGPES